MMKDTAIDNQEEKSSAQKKARVHFDSIEMNGSYCFIL